ncbi:MAG: YccF domain-containing protein [Prevotella sp.]|jgi:uncharacterized membrane protein YccF (DUF307 family)|nr:YccF domain-containing protein [Prevotella sp.]MCH3996019.1 YccF domain-containing protein [Prevotella sp.]
MKIIGNIVWLIFGGLETALEYLVASLVMMVTIIGIPFGIASLRIGLYVLWPFGQKVVSQQNDRGCLDAVMNVIWFLIGGVWIWLTHLLFGALLCITIIGIPFGRKQFQLAGLALTPFGVQIVPD